MNDSVENKVNKQSISNRRLVYGFGINDADYQIRPIINGKRSTCQIYRKWNSMLSRAYNPSEHARHPTYIGTTLCAEWHLFSNFRKWMIKQDWEGMELDKDIIKPGNKHYSPDNCCFVSKTLNNLLLDCGAARGKYAVGVCFHKVTGKFAAKCGNNGKRQHLGIFDTPEEASLVYRKFKANLVAEIAFEQEDERIEHGLMLHAALILKGDLN